MTTSQQEISSKEKGPMENEKQSDGSYSNEYVLVSCQQRGKNRAGGVLIVTGTR